MRNLYERHSGWIPVSTVDLPASIPSELSEEVVATTQRLSSVQTKHQRIRSAGSNSVGVTGSVSLAKRRDSFVIILILTDSFNDNLFDLY